MLRLLGSLLLAATVNGFTSLRPLPTRQNVAAKATIIPVGAQEIASVPPMTYEEVCNAAEYWGCRLEMAVLGPAYRVELRQTAWRRTEPEGGEYVNDNTGERQAECPTELAFKRTTGNPAGDTDDVLMVSERDLLGYTTGFAQPIVGVLHLDTMQVRRFSGYWANKPDYGGIASPKQGAPKPGTFGLGLLLGGAAACFGRECGCTKAELLAIRDDERQHAILVRYYRKLGFTSRREVGDDLVSFGDRLTWGGVGTLMDTDLVQWVKKFAPVIRQPDCGLL